MEEYPSNSKKSQSAPKGETKTEGTETTERKRIESVVVNEVTMRKKPLGKRFLETFGGGDAQSVGSYILADVLLPAAKDMVADAVSQGIEKMLFGETRGRSRGPVNRGYSPTTNYNSRYSNPSGGRPSDPRDRQDPRDRRQPMSHRARANHDFGEIVLASRAEADSVLSSMFAVLEEYQVVTVSDFYDLIGHTGSFADEKWGWDDLRGSTIHRVSRGGYTLDLPTPIPI